MYPGLESSGEFLTVLENLSCSFEAGLSVYRPGHRRAPFQDEPTGSLTA